MKVKVKCSWKWKWNVQESESEMFMKVKVFRLKLEGKLISDQSTLCKLFIISFQQVVVSIKSGGWPSHNFHHTEFRINCLGILCLVRTVAGKICRKFKFMGRINLMFNQCDLVESTSNRWCLYNIQCIFSIKRKGRKTNGRQYYHTLNLMMCALYISQIPSPSYQPPYQQRCFK